MDQAGQEIRKADKTEKDELKAEIKRLQAQVESLQEQLQTAELNVQNPSPEPLKDNHEVSDKLLNPNEAGMQVLLMDDILAELFKYFDVPSLAPARLVCTKWAKGCARTFQMRATMVVENMDIFDRSIKDFESTFPLSTPDSHKFKSLRIEKPSIFQEMLKRPWLRSYGKSLERLQIGAWIYTVGGMKSFLENPANEIFDPLSLEDLLLNVCPNLRSLIMPLPFSKEYIPSATAIESPRVVHLDLLHLGPDTEKLPGRTENFWKAAARPGFSNTLLTILNCISSLKKSHLSNPKSKGLQSLWPGIQNLARVGRVFQGIKNLDLGGLKLSAMDLDKLSMLDFANLEKLMIGGNSNFGALPTTSFLMFLEKVSPTLESLVIGELTTSGFGTMVFPELPKLRDFHNVGDVVRFESMDFVLLMPRLEHLEIKSAQGLFRPTIQLLLCPHLALKRLVLNSLGESGSSEFEMIRTCFPNLQNLRGTVYGDGKNLRDVLNGTARLLKLAEFDLSIKVSVESGELERIMVSTLPKLFGLKMLYLRTDFENSTLPPFTSHIFTSGIFKCPILKHLGLYNIKLSTDEDWNSILTSGEGEHLSVYIYPK